MTQNAKLIISFLISGFFMMLFQTCQTDLNQDAGNQAILLNDNTSWCWFQDERAMIDGEQLLFTGVTSEGENTVTTYHLETGVKKTVVMNDQTFEKIIPNLKEMKSNKLVDLLAHPNQWWRLQAQRLLLERQDVSVIPKTASMFNQHQDPRVRLHALYVLEGMGALNIEFVKQAMMDEHPGVREHGIILSERYPEMLPGIMECLKDSSARVSFQASLSLGEFTEKEALSALAEVLSQKGKNPFQQAEPWKLTFVEDISYSIGSRKNEEEIISYLEWLDNVEKTWQVTGVGGLEKGLKNNEGVDLEEVLENIEANAEMELKETIKMLKVHFTKSI